MPNQHSNYASVYVTREDDDRFSVVIDGIDFSDKIKQGGVEVRYSADTYGDAAEVTVTFMADSLAIRDSRPMVR